MKNNGGGRGRATLARRGGKKLVRETTHKKGKHNRSSWDWGVRGSGELLA